jgi:hypothetical protein
MKVTTSKVTITTTETTYEFTREDVIRALASTGWLPLSEASSVEHCHVRVPGGGDWSSTDLDLEDRPLIVVVKETITS